MKRQEEYYGYRPTKKSASGPEIQVNFTFDWDCIGCKASVFLLLYFCVFFLSLWTHWVLALHFLFILGGFEEHRRRSSSRDAQGNFRRPSKWGRNGPSDGRGWRRSHLPCMKPISLWTHYHVWIIIASRTKNIFYWRVVGVERFQHTVFLKSVAYIVIVWISLLVSHGVSSVHTTCLVTESTPSLPPSPPTLRVPRWPISDLSSFPRASPSRRQTPPLWCPAQTFSPQLHQRATQTTTPLQSECQHTMSHTMSTQLMNAGVIVSSYFLVRFSFEREGSPEEFYNPYEDDEPGIVYCLSSVKTDFLSHISTALFYIYFVRIQSVK